MGGEARKPQGDDYFFVWLDLKCHFGALGIAAAEKYYSPGAALA
jgi:hypothetical protein